MREHKSIRLIFGLPLIMVALLWLFSLSESLELLEWKTVDYRFRLQSQLTSHPQVDHLLLIPIDDATTDVLGRWPFPRRYHAKMMEELAAYTPSVVAWDILFVDPDQNLQNDKLLSQSIRGLKSFVSGSVTAYRTAEQNQGLTKPFKKVTGDRQRLTNFEQAQIPISGLTEGGYFGFVNCDPMSDGVRRFLPMIVSWKGEIYPSFTMQVVLRDREIDPDEVTVILGKEIVIPASATGPEIRIPINDEGKLLLNERWKINEWELIPYHELTKLMEEKKNHPENPVAALDLVRNSICLVGLGATGLGDFGATPLDAFTPLVNMHLNGINNILQSDFARPIDRWIQYLFFYFAYLFLTFVMVRLPFYSSMGISFLFFPVHLLLSVFLMIYGSKIILIAGPIVGIALTMFIVMNYRYVKEEREKRRIKRSLGAYLSPKIMQEVLSRPEGVQLGGSKKEITVLFCDLRGFTHYCEKRPPEQVLKLLNEYLQLMTDVIMKHEGTLDKYIGDAIMAFWGAPQEQSDHAEKAVSAAVEMRYALAQLRSKQEEEGEELFECGIGIHTGDAVVGNTGSIRQINYTAIGATVNMAARLEAMTKTIGVRILISESTKNRLSDEFIITPHGEVTLQGFSEPTKVFSVSPVRYQWSKYQKPAPRNDD